MDNVEQECKKPIIATGIPCALFPCAKFLACCGIADDAEAAAYSHVAYLL